MNKQLLSAIVVAFFIFSIVFIPQVAYCQTTDEATPTEEPSQTGTPDLLLVGVIAIIVIVAVIIVFLFLKKKTVNEKSLKKYSANQFQDWVIKKLNGKPSDPSSGINGFTEGGQPLLIFQSEKVSLAEVEDFVKKLVKGKTQKGAVVAFNFENDALEAKVTAIDQGIELEFVRIYELLNKRYANRIKSLSSAKATFEDFNILGRDDQAIRIETIEKEPFSEIKKDGFSRPRVFISQSNTKVANQVKKMLEFLQYDYVMGDKEETTVPIPTNKFGLMKDCDCAIINIAAAEQERRYSGLYNLNSNIVSEINAAYLKYNTQVVLLVERKIELPTNLKGLKRIEYDSDDLSFDAAMHLKDQLKEFTKI